MAHRWDQRQPYATSAIPYIGENGNWWVNQEDTGVQAQGPAGPAGKPGATGIGVAGPALTYADLTEEQKIELTAYQAAPIVEAAAEAITARDEAVASITTAQTAIADAQLAAEVISARLDEAAEAATRTEQATHTVTEQAAEVAAHAQATAQAAAEAQAHVHAAEEQVVLAREAANRAEAVSDVHIATDDVAGIVKPDGETIRIDEHGTLTAVPSIPEDTISRIDTLEGDVAELSEALDTVEQTNAAADTRLTALENRERTISQADYEALSEEERNNGTTYYVYDGVVPGTGTGTETPNNASDIRYVKDPADENFDWVQVQDAEGNWINIQRAYTQRRDLYMTSANEGNFEAYNGSLYAGVTPALLTVTCGDVMKVHVYAGNNRAEIGCVISELIDLSRFKTLHLYHKSSSGLANSTEKVRLFITQLKETKMTAIAYIDLLPAYGTSREGEVEFDISAINGEYYIGIQVCANSEGGQVLTQTEISDFYME